MQQPTNGSHFCPCCRQPNNQKDPFKYKSDLSILKAKTSSYRVLQDHIWLGPLLTWLQSYSVLMGFRTGQTLYSSHFNEKKMFSTQCLLRTCHTCQNLHESWCCPTRENAPQQKMLHSLVLVSLGTHPKLQNTLRMSTKVLQLLPSPIAHSAPATLTGIVLPQRLCGCFNGPFHYIHIAPFFPIFRSLCSNSISPKATTAISCALH